MATGYIDVVYGINNPSAALVTEIKMASANRLPGDLQFVPRRFRTDRFGRAGQCAGQRTVKPVSVPAGIGYDFIGCGFLSPHRAIPLSDQSDRLCFLQIRNRS